MTGTQGLTCQEVVEVVTDYLESQLADEERRYFEDHLRVCRGCTEYVEQMRQTITLAGQLGDEKLDPGTRDQLMQLFRDWNRSR